jgi:hypothetical protein
MVSASMLMQMMQHMQTLTESVAVVSASNKELVGQVKRLTRRQSGMVPPSTPFASPPRVSSATHSTFAQLGTPTVTGRQTTRLSLGTVPNNGYSAIDEEDADDQSDVEEAKLPSPQPREAEEDGSGDDVKLAKIMAKLKVPKSFSGATEAEREGVQSWTDDVSNYLQGQFGQLRRRYPEKEWTVALPLFEGTARMWIDSARLLNPSLTWEELKPGFVEFIRGGRETRAVQMEKLQNLVYGRGDCKNLLALERTFEELRVKLYPSSSTSLEMNELVAKFYGDALKRGNKKLYDLVVIMLATVERPTLSQWKTVAAKAVQMLQLGRVEQQQSHRGWNWRSPTEVLNELDEDTDGQEEDEMEGTKQEDSGWVTVQKVQGRRGPSRNPRAPSGPRPQILSDDDFRRVLEKKLCLQCYQPGHRRGHDACKEKGKDRRKPTAEELKVIKA